MKFKSNIGVQAGIEDNNDLTGDSGQILSSTGSGVAWIDQSAVTSASNFVFFNVKNETGSTILKGKGVMAVGTDGNSGHILIDEMVADGTVEPKYFLGVLEEDIPNGGFARVISFGQLDQFNTNGQNGETWGDGQILWCDPANPGDFTITEPDGPNVKIAAAFILNSSTNGKIQVRVQANEGIHDLHDTKITSQVDGDVLVWDNTTGVWFNDSTLNVDYTNSRVGIGTTSPLTKLQVSDTIAGYVSTIENLGTGADKSGLWVKTDSTWTSAIILKLTGSPSDVSIMEVNTATVRIGGGTITQNDSTLHVNGTSFFFDQAIFDDKVGIGTTSPAYKLEVSGNAALSIGADRYLRIGSSTNYWWDLQSVSNDFTLKEAGSNTRLIVKAGGNVGIGTTSPGTKLDVAGNANISDTLAIGSLSTVPTASLGRALNIQVLANSSGTTVAQWLDIDRTITTDSTSAATYGMVLRNASTTTSTANDGKIYGAQIIGRHQGTGGINSTMGVRGTADINTTGTITATGSLWGAYNEAQVTNGSVTFTNSGIFGTASRGQVLGSGTVNITSQGVVGGAFIGVLNNVNATVNRVAGGQFELDLQNGTTDKAHVVSLNTFNIVSPTNLSIDEFAYIYLGEDVAIPTTITDNAYFIKSLTSLPSELAGSIEATSFIKTGGTSSQFLKADGSIDSTSYAPATGGSYLPLSAGSGFPLTGDLWLDDNSGASPSLYLQNGSDNYWRLLNGSTGIFSLKEGTSDRITILPGGNVGIGTTIPSAKLHLVETGTTAAALFIDTARYGISLVGDGTSNSQYLLNLQSNGGSTDVMRVQSSGNVGIGTTNPGYKLEVEDTIGIKRAGVTATSTIQQTGAGLTVNAPSGYHPLIVQYAGAEFARINNSGNVGIGTTSPDTPLHIKNTSNNTGIKIEDTWYEYHIGTNNAESGNYFSLYRNSSNTEFNQSQGEWRFNTNSVRFMTINTSGNVGIGTTNPATWKLSVDSGNIYAASFDTSNNVGVVINGNNTTASQIIGFSNSNSTYNELHLRTNSTSTDGLYIDASGNVGIGTTSPERKLHVFAGESGGAASNTQSTLVLENSNNTYLQFLTPETSQSGILFGDTDNDRGALTYSHSSDTMSFAVAASAKMTILSSGNVGIGTTNPDSTLTIKATADSRLGGIGWKSNDGTNEWTIDAPNAGNFRIYKGATAVARFDSSGNFGIGTTTTSNKLTVGVSDSSTVQSSGGAVLNIFNVSSTTNNYATIAFGQSGAGSNSFSRFGVQYTDRTGGSEDQDFIWGTISGGSYSEKMRLTSVGNLDVTGTGTFGDNVAISGSVKVSDDTDVASANNVGAIRYRTSGNNSYVDMCMQTGASTYEWINIVQNNW